MIHTVFAIIVLASAMVSFLAYLWDVPIRDQWRGLPAMPDWLLTVAGWAVVTWAVASVALTLAVLHAAI